jgi:phosphatidate cytidylyltransferase
MSNLVTRIIFAVIAIPLTLVAVLKGGILFRGFLAVLLLGGGVEFYLMTKFKKMPVYLPLTLLGILLFCFRSTYALERTEEPLLFPVFFFIMLVLVVVEVFRADPEKALFRAGATLLSVFYIGFLGSYLMTIADPAALPVLSSPLIVRPKLNGSLLITLLFAVWGSDTFAFLFGKQIGGPLLLPRVSPKKTVAGLAGSVVGGIAGLLAGRTLFEPHFPSVKAVLIIGVLLGVLGQAGDLFESLIKRSCGVKDSSGIFPGHGGILDRLDALIFCAPVFYYALMFVR